VSVLIGCSDEARENRAVSLAGSGGVCDDVSYQLCLSEMCDVWREILVEIRKWVPGII
jgi:hypothetical protein